MQHTKITSPPVSIVKYETPARLRWSKICPGQVGNKSEIDRSVTGRSKCTRIRDDRIRIRSRRLMPRVRIGAAYKTGNITGVALHQEGNKVALQVYIVHRAYRGRGVHAYRHHPRGESQ